MNFAQSQYNLNLAKNLCVAVRFIVDTDEVAIGMARA